MIAHRSLAPGAFARAVVAIDEVGDADRVVAALTRRFAVIDDRDFFAAPRDGYRARHLQLDLGPELLPAEVHVTVREIAEVLPSALEAALRPFSVPLEKLRLVLGAVAEIYGRAEEAYRARNPGTPVDEPQPLAEFSEEERRRFESALREALGGIPSATLLAVTRLDVVVPLGFVDGGLSRIVADGRTAWTESWGRTGWEPGGAFVDEVCKAPPASRETLDRFGVP
jgi:hypothetical protein